MGKPSTSTGSSAISLRDAGGIRVLRTALRSSLGLVEELTKCIEADLGSEVVE
jgi:hypothetical protein